jgi:putative tryptophan/tyrosine transport system substrate-binding protein
VSVARGALASYGLDCPRPIVKSGSTLAAFSTASIPPFPAVQPTKFNLMFNLKTAKALGVEIPPNLIALADQIVE